MSSLDKMSVQGIRSFGPKDQDTQIITFFTPVTLIVGPNGCGYRISIERKIKKIRILQLRRLFFQIKKKKNNNY
jgi:hypothetical protein